jgi:putative transposase
MTYNPEIHHRSSIRLKEFNYSSSGSYFVTFVIKDRFPLLGEIIDARVKLNQFGNLVLNEWIRLPQRFPGIEIDEVVVMPNHFHGIITLTDSKPDWILAVIIGSFKSSTSRLINTFRKSRGNPVWQRNYYEHIIRNEEDLNRIREYIRNNPINWMQDEEYQ